MRLPRLPHFSSSAPAWLLMALCSALLGMLAQWLPLPPDYYPADEWLRDRYVAWQASPEPETRISLVDIDEASLAKLGPWPWPRARIADLIERLLADYQIKGVALDLFFPETADAEGDMRLAMLAAHGPVVLAQGFTYQQTPLQLGSLGGGSAEKNIVPAVQANGFFGNHAALAAAALHVGNIGYVPDKDGVLRHVPLWTAYHHKEYPTLSKALLDCCAPPAATENTQALTLDHAGYLRVPYSRRLEAYTVVKASSVLQAQAPLEFLRNTLVIIGSSSLSVSDRVTTPLSAYTSGFLVHAQALTSQLDAQSGHLPAAWPVRWIASLFAALTACLAAYTFSRLSALANTAILAAASLIWLSLLWWLLPRDPLFAPTGPLLTNLFLLAFAVPYGWQMTQGKSRRLLGTLHQYVAKAVVEELLRSDMKDPLAPRQSHVTTLIADMEAYTSHVESLPVSEAADLTRDFLECLTGPVLEKGGTLDKYTGDGLVAFWGAPLPIVNHADLALDAALAIVDNVRQLNARLKSRGMKPLRVRIGEESGIAMAGDFGTRSRSIYTAVGDSVNVASRLEDVAREFPHDIIVGQGTVDLAQRHRFQLLGEKILRGKELPTTLFTVELQG
jgi:adenylate cyclase